MNGAASAVVPIVFRNERREKVRLVIGWKPANRNSNHHSRTLRASALGRRDQNDQKGSMKFNVNRRSRPSWAQQAVRSAVGPPTAAAGGCTLQKFVSHVECPPAAPGGPGAVRRCKHESCRSPLTIFCPRRFLNRCREPTHRTSRADQVKKQTAYRGNTFRTTTWNQT